MQKWTYIVAALISILKQEAILIGVHKTAIQVEAERILTLLNDYIPETLL